MRLKCTSAPFAVSIAAEMAAPRHAPVARTQPALLARPLALCNQRRRRRNAWQTRGNADRS